MDAAVPAERFRDRRGNEGHPIHIRAAFAQRFASHEMLCPALTVLVPFQKHIQIDAFASAVVCPTEKASVSGHLASVLPTPVQKKILVRQIADAVQPSFQLVKNIFRFALTGTPVENRLGELWSIFSFLMPGYLPPYKSFCSRFEKPITQENDPAAVRRLNQLTGPFILRRMKSEVLKELPPKTENVYRIELEEEQRKLYLAAVVDAREKLRAAKPEDKMAVFAVLMRLREICCDPRLIADNWTGGSAKLDACIELVTSAVEGGHRILLFSQFTSMLELLAKRLDAEGVSHFTLQGSTPKPVRAELVRRFNGGEASVFLISLRAGGTGLNLTAADIVIHYDPWWNVAAQNQATDRAYRIGQQNPVQVYKLIAQDTIEEKIVELQQAKQDLAETVTGSADGAILRMKPEELLNLLEGTE